MNFPAGYPPSAACGACSRDFVSVALFDQHRVGVHAYTFEQGLKLDPPVEDGRRCLDPEEMEAKGWRPMSDAEKRSSGNGNRAAFPTVELWFDPVKAEQMRERFRDSSGTPTKDSAQAEGRAAQPRPARGAVRGQPRPRRGTKAPIQGSSPKG